MTVLIIAASEKNSPIIFLVYPTHRLKPDHRLQPELDDVITPIWIFDLGNPHPFSPLRHTTPFQPSTVNQKSKVLQLAMTSYWYLISLHHIFGSDLTNIVGPFLRQRFVGFRDNL